MNLPTPTPGSMTKLESTPSNNPLPEIINSLPWEPRLVTIDVLDNIREILTKACGYSSVFTDKYIMLVLLMLQDNKFCVVQPIQNEIGDSYLITRI